MSTFLFVVQQAGDGLVHILVFNDPEDIHTWDVACCGTSLGDYDPLRLERDEGLPAHMACATCFKAFGDDRSTGRLW
jgi:hypothetical protein